MEITKVLGTVAMVPKGEYDAEEHYEYLNVVTYNGSSYMAKKSSTGVLPTNDEYWQLVAQKASRTYQSVADMKSDDDLKEGMVAETLGYYEPNDGGEATYQIVDDDTLIDNGGSIHDLSIGLKAKLITEGEVNFKQFGAKGDGETNDFDAINNCCQYANSNDINIHNKIENYYINGTQLVLNTSVIIQALSQMPFGIRSFRYRGRSGR